VTFQLVNAKVWDGSQWVLAAGGAPETLGYPQWDKTETQVSVTTGGTAHTMGAWVEVVASTSQVWDWVGIDPQTTFVNTADTRTLLDIGIGPSGSETIIVQSVPIGHSDGFSARTTAFPVRIPAGSRVAVRTQSVRTSIAYTPRFVFGSNASISATSIVTIGDDRTESRGATLVQTSLVEVGTTAQDFQALLVLPGTSGDTLTTNNNLALELAIGPSGSETVVSRQRMRTANNEVAAFFPIPPFPVWYVEHVPSGTRLSARVGNVASVYPIVYGVPYP
jgi:hypothetical protein